MWPWCLECVSGCVVASVRECNVKRKTARNSKILIHSFRGQQALDRAGQQGRTRVLVARCNFEHGHAETPIHASIAEHHVGQIENHVGAQPGAEHQCGCRTNHQPHRNACHTRLRQQAQRSHLSVKRRGKRVRLNRRRHGEDYTSANIVNIWCPERCKARIMEGPNRKEQGLRSQMGIADWNNNLDLPTALPRASTAARFNRAFSPAHPIAPAPPASQLRWRRNVP